MKFITIKHLLKNVLKPVLIRIINTILKYIKKTINLLPARVMIIIAVVVIAFLVTAVVFYSRSPVLVVTDTIFIELYGKERIRRQGRSSSFALFRRVKPVITADGASPDIIVTAISGAARNPYCVLFPGYLAPAAEQFHLQFPEIRAVILGGFSAAYDLPRPDGVLCVYQTDLNTDLYRAGLFAGTLGLKKGSSEAQKTCFFWQDRHILAAERDVFFMGLREIDPGAAARFVNSTLDIPSPEGISCVILTSSGTEYFEENAKIPLILFTWLDIAILPAETAAVFDDSTWALVVPAARMAVNNQSEGKIPSKPLVFSGGKADNGIDRILKQLAKKMP